jgi:hypothetical protein
VELTVRVEALDPLAVTRTLVRLRLAVSPEGETVLERFTVPEKPSTLLRVIWVEIGLEPCRRVRVDPDVMLKSTTLTESCAERVDVPEFADTVTVKVAVTCEEMVRVEVPLPPCEMRTLEGSNIAVRPGEETVAANVRVPEKPLIPPRSIVILLGTPLSMMIEG